MNIHHPSHRTRAPSPPPRLRPPPALAQPSKVNLGVVDSGGDAQLHGRHRVLGQPGEEGPGEGSTRT